MANFMLNLTDTTGKPLQLPLAVNTEETGVTLASTAVDGAYLDPDAPTVDGIVVWERDSWKLTNG